MSGPPEPDIWVPIHVTITDRETGERRDRIQAFPYFRRGWADDQEGIWYAFAEGNDSCDCNRSNIFARARNEPDIDAPCSGHRFAATVRHAGTNELIFDDSPPPA